MAVFYLILLSFPMLPVVFSWWLVWRLFHLPFRLTMSFAAARTEKVPTASTVAWITVLALLPAFLTSPVYQWVLFLVCLVVSAVELYLWPYFVKFEESREGIWWKRGAAVIPTLVLVGMSMSRGSYVDAIFS